MNSNQWKVTVSDLVALCACTVRLPQVTITSYGDLVQLLPYSYAEHVS